MFCANCGSRLEDDALFCTQCGMRVQAEGFVSAAPENFSYADPSEQGGPQEQQWGQPMPEQQAEQVQPAVTQPYDHVATMEAAQEVRETADSSEAYEAAQAMGSTPSVEQQAIENFEQQAVQNQEIFADDAQPVFQTYDQWQQPMDHQWNQYSQPMDQQWQQPADQQWNQYGQPMDQQWNQYGQPVDQQWQQPMDQQWNQYGQPVDQQWQQPVDQQWNQYGQPMDQQWQQPMDQQWNQYGQPMDQQWQQPADQQWNQYGQPMDQQWQQSAEQQRNQQSQGFAPAGYDQNYGQPQRARKEKKKKSKAPLFITLGVVVLALAAAAVWWFFLRDQKTDIALSKYISADFSGVDGYGTISAYLDYDALQKDIWIAMGHKEEEMTDSKSQKELAKVHQFTSELYASISQKEALKNGDKVKVSIDVPEQIPEDLCINITDSEKEFTVEGLQEVQMFDPFEGIEVTFRGMDPFVRADYERIKQDDLYYYVDFTLDKTSGLSAGDTVTVTATYNKDYLNEMGYGVNTDSKTYTVTSEGAYILDAAKLNETIKADLDARSKTFQQEQSAGWIDVAELKDMAYLGYAFIADDDFDPDYNTRSNTLFTVYNVYISTDDGPMIVYLFYGYENVMQDGQGIQYTQTEVPYQVTDLGVENRVWTAKQKYYIAGFGSIDEMKAFLDNYYRQDGDVFFNVQDIPPRNIDWQPAVPSEPGHLTDDPNGYILPNSNTEYLDETFLKTLTDQELQYARNEIVARYGRKFKTPEIAAYFAAKTWYVPTYEPEEFDKKMDSMINAFERANIALINKIEAERAAQKKQ